MKLEFIGTGEAFHYGKGNSSILFSGEELPTVLFDCGYQIPERLWEKGCADSIDAIYITHTHADHVFGLIPLLTKYVVGKRERKLTIIGRKGIKEYVRAALELGYQGVWERIPFPLSFIEVDANQTIELNSLKMRFAQSEHVTTNYSVRVDLPDGKSFAISGDGQITEATSSLYDGVNVLVHELYKVHPKAGHTDLKSLGDLMKKINVGQLFVTHVANEDFLEIEKSVIGKIATPLMEVSL